MVLIAISSESLEEYWAKILNLVFENIGTFITQSQVMMKLFCLTDNQISEMNNHINGMFTQVGDVISFLDIFHVFAITDAVALIQEPFEGDTSAFTKMYVGITSPILKKLKCL